MEHIFHVLQLPLTYNHHTRVYFVDHWSMDRSHWCPERRCCVSTNYQIIVFQYQVRKRARWISM